MPNPYRIGSLVAMLLLLETGAEGLSAQLTAGPDRLEAAPVPDDGGDDTAALQAALNATPAGSRLTLAAGVYLVSAPLKVPPGVVLAGPSMEKTTLRLAPGSWSHFGYDFLVGPASVPSSASPQTGVMDLTLDGNRSSGGAAPNQGGGVRLGSYWQVQRVRFINFNYFRVWALDTSQAMVSACVFENPPGTSASDNDNIGGGNNLELTLESNTFKASSVGNPVDLLNSQRLHILGHRSERGSIYLEGVQDSEVRDSVLLEGGIVLQTDVGYSSSTGLLNPARNQVVGNQVIDAPTMGISIRYDVAQGLPMTPGGGNRIEGNSVIRPTYLGIAVFGAADGAKRKGDRLLRNTIEDVLSPPPYTLNTGYGTFDDAGIGLSIGRFDEIAHNVVRDTQTPPTTLLDITLGTHEAITTPTQTLLFDNTQEGF